MIVSEKVGNWR